MRPDVNVDLGEHDDEPEALYELATRVNIACGGHAGDAASIRQALALAKRHGCLAGAHPSYPDRANFGRVTMPLAIDAIASRILSQISEFHFATSETGLKASHVKLHGALYHDADRAPELAEALVDVIGRELGKVALVGPANGAWQAAAHAKGHPYLVEGFADRRYRDDGSLAPRSEAGAVLTNPDDAARQAAALAATGRYDTLCVHADTPNAVELARAVRRALESA